MNRSHLNRTRRKSITSTNAPIGSSALGAGAADDLLDTGRLPMARRSIRWVEIAEQKLDAPFRRLTARAVSATCVVMF